MSCIAINLPGGLFGLISLSFRLVTWVACLELTVLLSQC